MFPDESDELTLKEYRTAEIGLHSELMKICRNYINELGIISIIGILDIVKQETIELEGATRRNIKIEDAEPEPKPESKSEENTEDSF